MKIEFILSQKEQKKAKGLITKADKRNKWLTILCSISAFLAALFITLGFMIVIKHVEEVYHFYPEFIYSIGYILLGFFIWSASRWYISQKLLKDSELEKAIISYEVLPDKILHKVDDGLKQEILPSEIQRLVDIQGFLLIFVRTNYAYYVPERAFSDNDERERFKKEVDELTKK